MNTQDLKNLIEKQGFHPLSEMKEGKLAGGFVALASGTVNNCDCFTLTNDCRCDSNNCDCPPIPTNPNCRCKANNCNCYLTNEVPTSTEAPSTSKKAVSATISLTSLW